MGLIMACKFGENREGSVSKSKYTALSFVSVQCVHAEISEARMAWF